MNTPVKSLMTLLLALSVSAASFAADVKVRGEASYKPHQKIVLSSDAAKTARLLWDVEPIGNVQLPDFEEVGGKLFVWAAPGQYRVTLTAVDFEKKDINRARFTFKVEGKVPPKPPEPGPDPDPPEPDDGEGTNPIKEPGFRVLVVYESEELADLPASQVDAMYSKTVRDFLNAKCAAGKDGKTREWRIWDENVPVDNEAKHWQDAMKRPRKSLPWLLISNGDTKKGYEGPFPKHTEELMIILRKYAGN